MQRHVSFFSTFCSLWILLFVSITDAAQVDSEDVNTVKLFRNVWIYSVLFRFVSVDKPELMAALAVIASRTWYIPHAPPSFRFLARFFDVCCTMCPIVCRVSVCCVADCRFP